MSTKQKISLKHNKSLELDDHLEVADLIRYHEGSLPEDEMKMLPRHLVGCSTCMRLLLDLAAFLDDGPKNSSLTDEELESAWDALQNQRQSSESGSLLAPAVKCG